MRATSTTGNGDESESEDKDEDDYVDSTATTRAESEDDVERDAMRNSILFCCGASKVDSVLLLVDENRLKISKVLTWILLALSLLKPVPPPQSKQNGAGTLLGRTLSFKYNRIRLVTELLFLVLTTIYVWPTPLVLTASTIRQPSIDTWDLKIEVCMKEWQAGVTKSDEPWACGGKWWPRGMVGQAAIPSKAVLRITMAESLRGCVMAKNKR
ncbi:hypothetical protein B0H13DRAFT_2262487 [Mycena leptocephala]|nr:hypothetical protein B0H13DRAFT_2262487 [Mycena leptocephala]